VIHRVTRDPARGVRCKERDNIADVIGLGQAVFKPIVYSLLPILAVPVGRMTLELLIAVLTSLGLSPLAYSAFRLISTMASRGRPPYGGGIVTPPTVASGVRTVVPAMALS
jgi:hypothetical protein